MPQSRDLSSLRLLGSVGEPINPEAWLWYHKYVGGERCPIADTWWQTETGGILITPLPGAWPTIPGFATLPFFGVDARALQPRSSADQPALDAPVNEQGELCIARSWPGMMRGVFGEPERFFNTYFVQQPGFYFSGDGAIRNEDGYFRLMGRIDDVVNVSGHRMGTAEVEAALNSLTTAVAESADVGFPHDIKGEDLYAYIILKTGVAGMMHQKSMVDTSEKRSVPSHPRKIRCFGSPKTSFRNHETESEKVAAGAIDELAYHNSRRPSRYEIVKGGSKSS